MEEKMRKSHARQMNREEFMINKPLLAEINKKKKQDA
jgi:hypothetical protein